MLSGYRPRGFPARRCAHTGCNQDEDNYLLNYHAMSDTFDKVDLARLKKHVAGAAAITFAIADSPERIGAKLNVAQISQIKWKPISMTR